MGGPAITAIKSPPVHHPCDIALLNVESKKVELVVQRRNHDWCQFLCSRYLETAFFLKFNNGGLPGSERARSIRVFLEKNIDGLTLPTQWISVRWLNQMPWKMGIVFTFSWR